MLPFSVTSARDVLYRRYLRGGARTGNPDVVRHGHRGDADGGEGHSRSGSAELQGVPRVQPGDEGRSSGKRRAGGGEAEHGARASKTRAETSQQNAPRPTKTPKAAARQARPAESDEGDTIACPDARHRPIFGGLRHPSRAPRPFWIAISYPSFNTRSTANTPSSANSAAAACLASSLPTTSR